MRSLQTRLEKVEMSLKTKMDISTLTMLNANDEVLCQYRIPGNESIVFVEDLEETGVSNGHVIAES